jgi:hypothetical protein
MLIRRTLAEEVNGGLLAGLPLLRVQAKHGQDEVDGLPALRGL